MTRYPYRDKVENENQLRRVLEAARQIETYFDTCIIDNDLFGAIACARISNELYLYQTIDNEC